MVKPGKRTLTLKSRKAARRALAHRSRTRVKIRVALTPKGGSKQTVTVSTTLKPR